MARAKKYQRYDHYLLRGKLCHNGFERWRYAFVGASKTTGEERAFFVELYLVNPAVSPKEPVLAQKSRLSLSETDLQYALAGTVSAQNAGAELAVQPSYALVKAGMFGADGKQLNAFFAPSKLSWHKNEAEFVVSNCTFGADRMTGAVRVAPSEIRERPEMLWAALACRGAVKARTALAPQEGAQLLEEWVQSQTDYCPHGRPVARKIDFSFFERLFKRRQ